MNAAEFKSLRQKLQLKQQFTADAVNVCRRTVQHWENSSAEVNCDVAFLYTKIDLIFNKIVDEFIKNADEKNEFIRLKNDLTDVFKITYLLNLNFKNSELDVLNADELVLLRSLSSDSIASLLMRCKDAAFYQKNIVINIDYI